MALSQDQNTKVNRQGPSAMYLYYAKQKICDSQQSYQQNIKMIRLWLLLAACLSVYSMHISQIHQLNLLSSSQVDNLRAVQLQKHNQYRAKHGCNGLVVNSSLNDIAQNYSEYLGTQVHKLVHSSGDYGENLYKKWGSPTLTYQAGTASNKWYAESAAYTYGVFPPASGTGHFTAMIWKGVTSVGFGYYKVQENNGFAIYVVANYYPSPNIYTQNYYLINVPPPV